MSTPAAADRVRLAEQLAAARQLLAAVEHAGPDLVYWCGRLEVMLSTVCEMAERAFGEPEVLARLEQAGQ